MKNKAAYDALMKFYPLTLDDLQGEVWLPVAGFEDYHVSNFGRVKSFQERWRKPRILRPSISRGYLRVTFCKGGKTKHFQVHQLVSKVFIPNPEGKPEVNHIDGHPLNNHISNLEWCTSSENQRHAVDTGLQSSGEDSSRAKLSNQQVRYIRNNPDKLNLAQFAEMFGVSQTVISAVQLGKKYKSAGGSIRGKIDTRIPDDIRAAIRQDYQKGVKGRSTPALAKKYGIGSKTVWDIVNKSQADD